MQRQIVGVIRIVVKVCKMCGAIRSFGIAPRLINCKRLALNTTDKRCEVFISTELCERLGLVRTHRATEIVACNAFLGN